MSLFCTEGSRLLRAAATGEDVEGFAARDLPTVGHRLRRVEKITAAVVLAALVAFLELKVEAVPRRRAAVRAGIALHGRGEDGDDKK